MRSRSGAMTFIGRTLLVIMVVAGLGFLASRLMHMKRSAQSTPIGIDWKRRVRSPVTLAMSTDGKLFGVVDQDGNVRLFDARGELRWTKQVPEATNVLIARHGQALLIYSRLNRTRPKVHFFTATGRLLWRHTITGAIRAGAVSPDGDTVAVTTADGFVYIYRPHPVHPKFRRWRITGVGDSVAFTPKGDRVIVGAWMSSRLICFDLDGRVVWKSKQKSNREYDVTASADGLSILSFLSGTELLPNTELTLCSAQGEMLWRKELCGYDARALVSPHGQKIAVSYATCLSSSRPDMVERRIAVYEAGGGLLWEKGGLFFGPQLVALTPDGSSVIVSDGDHTLYMMDSQGRMHSKLEVGGRIRGVISSEDGSKVLFYCDDGWLYQMSAARK